MLHKSQEDAAGSLWSALAGALDEEELSPELRAALESESTFSQLAERWSAGTTRSRATVLKALVPWARSLQRLESSLLDLPYGDVVEQCGSAAAQPPSWWRAHSDAIFASLRHLRRAALELVALEQPLEVKNLAAFLEERRALEREQEGAELSLRYPGGELLVYRGYYPSQQPRADHQTYRSGFLQMVALLQSDDCTPEQLRALQAQWPQRGAEKQREHPLATLYDLQQEIVANTACEPEEALVFLLCDVVPELPFVRIGARCAWYQGKARTGESPIRITVGSPKVPAYAVAAAYADFLRVGLPEGFELNAPRAEAPLLALAFVREYRERAAADGRRVSWPAMWAAFNAAHPGTYGSLRSFQQTVYRQESYVPYVTAVPEGAPRVKLVMHKEG